ncbi:MAG: right-handed parallel beta-helix repeat-containing protein [Bacillota bacterium]
MTNALGLGVPQYVAPADWQAWEVVVSGVATVPHTGLYVTDQPTLDALVAYSQANTPPLVFLTMPPVGYTQDSRFNTPLNYYPTPALLAQYLSSAAVSAAAAAASAAAAGVAIYWDPKKYGAKYDGTTDDAGAINAAINAASAAGGGLVWLGGALSPNTKASSGSNGHSIKIASSIVLQSGVSLRGLGPATQITPSAGVTAIVVTPDTQQVADFMEIRDLHVSGGATAVNITNSGSGGTQLGWPRLTIENVTANDQSSHAFNHTYGAFIETRWINCVSLRAGGFGFYIQATDNMLTNCTAAAGAAAGFEIGGANNKVVGCKAYGNATVGFQFANGGYHVAVGCESQDNNGGGYEVGGGAGSNNTLVGCQANTNGVYGFQFSSSYNCVEGATVKKNGGGSANVTPTAFLFTSNFAVTQNNLVSGQTDCTAPVGGNVRGNTVRLGAMGGRQQVAYAATLTPNPYNGEIFATTLTGNVTIANPVYKHEGQRLTLELTQDGTGGRTVTFGSRFRTSGAITTTANTLTTIHFEFDGMNWQQVSMTTGLTAPASLASDNFTRANGAIGTSSGGTVWTVSGAGTPSIVSNQGGVVGSPGQTALAWLATSSPDYTYQVTWTFSASAGSVLFRGKDASNYYVIGTNSIYRVDAGAPTAITTGTFNITSGMVVKVVCAGPSVNLYLNGTLTYSFSDAVRTADGVNVGFTAAAVNSTTSSDYFTALSAI